MCHLKPPKTQRKLKFCLTFAHVSSYLDNLVKIAKSFSVVSQDSKEKDPFYGNCLNNSHSYLTFGQQGFLLCRKKDK